MRIEVLAYDHPDAGPLIDGCQYEDLVRYGQEDQTPVDPADFAAPRGLFLVGYLDDRAVACGGWRTHGPDAELKRMYVVPEARRRGLARSILIRLEDAARDAGRHRMILETGTRQPEALALYGEAGYVEVPKFGYYADDPESVHLGKVLGQAR
jgi:GNAT superfamily N-acetyltransferase